MKRIFIIALIISSLFLLSCTGQDKEALAQCLAQNEVAMYGTETCPHCLQQKYLFGDAFRFVPYVDCQENLELCIKTGIEAYPTWANAEGEKLVGRQDLNELAKWAGCEW